MKLMMNVHHLHTLHVGFDLKSNVYGIWGLLFICWGPFSLYKSSARVWVTLPAVRQTPSGWMRRTDDVDYAVAV